MDARWQIRRARAGEGDRLVPIERRCFRDPWSASAFDDILGSPLGIGVVGERAGEVQGYLIARAVAGEGEILNLAVAPEVRRQGLGAQLLEAGIAELTAAGAREVFLEVREHNLAAQQLYQRRGFRPVALRARYYRNPVEDAIVLRLALPGGA
ncbi:MAG TPA: ribosomal protein S18-alanine N-acetyltransferase [Gemmatimonadales bacterium]|jgi:ribosomal-protein-alanine N-acetyltransferase